MFCCPEAEGAEEFSPAQGFDPELYTQIGETADVWKSSLVVRMDTG
jgi:hypothetical protein